MLGKVRRFVAPASHPPAPANEFLDQLTACSWNCNPTPKRPSGSRWQ